jgi:hypothetical protein
VSVGNRDRDRVVVLLGAGASRDAGLPLTEELARRLVEDFDAELNGMVQWDRNLPRQKSVVRALHAVYGAMVAHATSRGESPLTAVNVERLVSAVRLLRDRSDHEVTPFVAEWLRVIQEIDSHPLSVSDSDLEKTLSLDLDHGFRSSGLSEKIAQIARDINMPGDGDVFRDLERQLLQRVTKILANPSTVDYLSPLMDLAASQRGGLNIATLNYDTTVEMVAHQAGVSINTGFHGWRPGESPSFFPIDGVINLLKIHGSVDWTRRRRNSHSPEHNTFTQFVYEDEADPMNNADPLIIVGDREKLTAEGPTLGLMRAFEKALLEADRLVVVGYSFRDAHINTVVANWLGAEAHRTITILDPGWTTPPQMVIGYDTDLSFWDSLRYEAGISLTAQDGRVLVIPSTAKDGLAQALVEAPLSRLTQEIALIACLDEDQPFLRICNRGYDLHNVEIQATNYATYLRQQPLANLRLEPDAPGTEGVSIPLLSHDETRVVYFDIEPEHEPRTVFHLTGTSWRRHERQRFDVYVRNDPARWS